MKVYQIPEASRTAKGRPIVNLLNLKQEEQIAGILSLSLKELEDKFIVLITEKGIVKKTSLAAYSRPRQGGIIGLSIDEGDRLIAARLSDGSQDLLLATRNGMSIRFKEEEVRAIGRTGRGVMGIRLREGDRVVGAEIVEQDKTVLIVTESGLGKRTIVEDYPVQGRGGYGVITLKSNVKTGSLVGIRQVSENDEILIISMDGNIIRLSASDVSVIGRNTQGVRLVNLKDSNKVVSFEKLVE